MEAGQSVVFDVLFAKDTLLPAKGEAPLQVVRRYVPTHNLGDFRYLECSRVDQSGQPQGDLAPWDEILFPYDPALQTNDALKDVAVARNNGLRNLVEERYTCNSQGVIEVEIADVTTGYQQTHRLRGK